jgi:hypothetical protein
MAKLYLLDSPSDARICAIAIDFEDSKPTIKLQWTHAAPLSSADVLATSKECATRCLARLMEQGREEAISSTNWASVVAGCSRHVHDWNEKLKVVVYSEGGGVAGERLQ